MVDWMGILNTSFYGNTIQAYLISIFVFILVVASLKIIKELIVRRMEKAAQKTETRVDDFIAGAVDKSNLVFFIAIGIYFSLRFLVVPEGVERIINTLLLIVVFYVIATEVNFIISFLMKSAVESRDKKTDPTIITVFGVLAKIGVWTFAIVLILSNLGFNVSGVLAGLGIGGVAIALALQNILGDIFASFSIYLDKPFIIGDFIVIGEDMGTVKKIGIKTTRLKTMLGDELIVSNKELTSKNVHNYKKLKTRRVTFELGISYDTKNAKVKKIPTIIKKVINSQKLCTTWGVFFRKYGDFAMIYEVIYYISTGDFETYLNTHHKINERLKAEFEKEKIKLPYPTQEILVRRNK